MCLMSFIVALIRYKKFKYFNASTNIVLGFVISSTVVTGFRVLGFSALPGFRALKAVDEAWSVLKTLFEFK